MPTEKPQSRDPLDFMPELQGDLEIIGKEGRKRIRVQKREIVESRSQDLANEQARIAQTIGLLYDAVYYQPDKATPEILMDFVQNHPEGSFSEKVTKQFAAVLESYRQKRAVVQKFVRENKDPNLMFEKCFGIKPVGKIEVVPGPMTLCFRCFTDEDYIAAYTHGVASESAEDLKTKKIERAKKSGGTAFSKVKIAELSGSVIAERAGNNSEDRPIYHKREVNIKGREKNNWQRFNYPAANEADLVYFKIPEIGEIEAHLRRNSKGKIVAIRLVRSSDSEEIADIDPFEKTETLKIPIPAKKYGADEWVGLEFAASSFAIYDHTKIGAGFETVEYVGTERVVKDKDVSRQKRLHEEQHQFNKLFQPENNSAFNLPYLEFLRLGHYAEAHPEENVVSLVAQKFARIFRQAYIDSRARDEIIAFTREGYSPKGTFLVLSQNPLYNYKGELIAGTKDTIGDFVKNETLRLTKTLLTKGSAEFVIRNSGYVVDFNLKKQWTPDDQTAAQSEAERVLAEDYEKKLQRWTDLIKSLKKRGYETKDIVPFLGMFPINQWHSAIRRLIKSKTINEIKEITEVVF